MNNYKELKVWQKSVELSTRIYQITIGFPKDELYGLTSQLRRTSVSVLRILLKVQEEDQIRIFHIF